MFWMFVLALLCGLTEGAEETAVIDNFEGKMRWEVRTARAAAVKKEHAAAEAENRVLKVHITVPDDAEQGGRVYAALPLQKSDFSGYDGIRFRIMYDKPNEASVRLLVREESGSWYREDPLVSMGDANNWHWCRVSFRRMKWFFERKSDANDRLDLSAITGIELFFNVPAGTDATFYIDDLMLWRRPPAPKENLIRLRTERGGQIFFLPEPIVIEAWLDKPKVKGTLQWTFEAKDIEGEVAAQENVKAANPSEHIKIEFGGTGYFDVVASASDDTGLLRERKFSVGAVLPLSDADDAVVEGSPFGIWVGGGSLPEKLGIRWKRIYCQPWDFEPEGDGYKWVREKGEPFFRGIREKFPKTELICYFRGMPKWLTSRPDRTDYKEFPPTDWGEYARFIRYYVRNTKERVHVWEVWNEPVPYAGWHGTIEGVVKLHEVTYRAVHAEQPEATVIGPCPYTFKWDFLEKFFELGGAKWIDAVVVHAYRPRGRGPEETDYEGDLKHLREMMSPYPHLKDIYITELGWSSSAVTEREQADYLVRSLVQTVAAGVKAITWHMYWDYNDVEMIGGHGILRYDHTPKPALVAYAVLAQQLLRAKFIGKVEHLSGKSLGYRFQKDGRGIWAVWNWGDKPVEVNLHVGHKRVDVCDMFGRTREEKVTDGMLKIQLDNHPLYVRVE